MVLLHPQATDRATQETGRRIAQHRKKSRFSSSSPSSFSLPRLRPLLFFFSFSSFSLPRLRPLEIGWRQSKSIITSRFRVVMDGNNCYLAIPPGSGRSMYRSTGGLINKAQKRKGNG
ncbi:hypothetical protein BHM03_00016974 [Ensete ventricosum]|nr:hypothetical protein BHM03_00016974 [Ensete ventricosum]